MISVDVSFARRLGSIGSRLFEDCTSIVVQHARRRRAAVSFVILDDARIQEMNVRFLGHDYATDVITFPLGEEGELDGEVYIGADTAAAQAREHGVPFREEIARLAVHGLLHLLGHDDMTPEAAARMHELQEHLVGKWRSLSSPRA